MSSATLTVLLSSLFVLAVFIAFTSAEDTEDTEDTCTSTCVNNTESTLIAMDWQSFMLILKLNDDGTPIVGDYTSRKKRQAGGKPDDKGGKPDDKGGKPDGKGKGKKFCRPGKGEVTKLFKKLRKIGLPLVIKPKRILRLDDKKNQFPMTPTKGHNTFVCGRFSTELKDIDDAPINATLYVICNTFTGSNVLTAKVCIELYVVHHSATLKNNKMLSPNGIEWIIKITDFQCTDQPSSNLTCDDLSKGRVRVRTIVDLGKGSTGKCDKDCRQERRQSGGGRTNFDTIVRVNDNVEQAVYTYAGNQHNIEIPFGDKIEIDPTSHASTQEAAVEIIEEGFYEGESHESGGSGGISVHFPSMLAILLFSWLAHEMPFNLRGC